MRQTDGEGERDENEDEDEDENLFTSFAATAAETAATAAKMESRISSQHQSRRYNGYRELRLLQRHECRLD